MKVRLGYVSNSSSSSFIISFKDKKVAEIVTQLFVDCQSLKEYLGDRNYENCKDEIIKKAKYKYIYILDVPYGAEEMLNMNLKDKQGIEVRYYDED